ncbi:MAG: glycosyltransferase family 9 protein [Fibrobacteres bacterium]|nr:glycosyltransferase family 9 protein [Fibrobacterota bacterium]
MNRILIIRLSSFGDILLTTLAVRCIRKRFPSAHIDFVTRTPYVSLMSGNPYVNSVVALDVKNLAEVLRVRKKIRGQYDLIVDLHVNFRTYLLSLFTGAVTIRTKRFDFKRRLMALFHTKGKGALLPVPLRHLSGLKKVGVVDDGGGIEFSPPPDSVMAAKTLLLSHHIRDGYIVLSPGSRWLTKEWPKEKFAELISLMPQERFVILGGRQDEATGKMLETVDRTRVVSLCGKTDPASAGEVIRRAKAVLTNDSGLMHMATAVGIPVVAIFGCTVQEFGFAPFRGKSIVLERDLKCRPCATKGRKECPLGTLECLTSITADDAADALESLPGK